MNKRVGRPKEKLQPVLVKWRDARFYPGTYWRDEIEDAEMVVFESVGYLVRRDATTTVLAGETNDEKGYGDITLIPTGTIVSVRRLTLGPLVRFDKEPT